MNVLVELLKNSIQQYVGQDMTLTGSFYFGGDTVASDIDLFVEESDQLINKLESLGFKKVTDAKNYADNSLSALYYANMGSLLVQVQVIKVGWYQKKKNAQTILNQYIRPYMPHMQKSFRKTLWDMVMALV
jgi:hypothetical protein